MAERPVEQERAREIAEWAQHTKGDVALLARAHLTLLAAYEDRSEENERLLRRWKEETEDADRLIGQVEALDAQLENSQAAFERAAADCVRLEGALREIYEHEASLVANCYGASKALRVSAAALDIPEAKDAATPKPVVEEET